MSLSSKTQTEPSMPSGQFPLTSGLRGSLHVTIRDVDLFKLVSYLHPFLGKVRSLC